MTHDQVREVAARHKLGPVHFQLNIARNTGQEFEVGYVYVAGEQTLFCKRQPLSEPDGFYLCNEFRKISPEVP